MTDDIFKPEDFNYVSDLLRDKVTYNANRIHKEWLAKQTEGIIPCDHPQVKRSISMGISGEWIWYCMVCGKEPTGWAKE